MEAEYFHLKIEELTAESSELSAEITFYREEFKDQMLNLDRAITGEFRFNSLRESILKLQYSFEDGTVEGILFTLPFGGRSYPLSRTSLPEPPFLSVATKFQIGNFPRTNQIALDFGKFCWFFYQLHGEVVLVQRRELPFDNDTIALVDIGLNQFDCYSFNLERSKHDYLFKEIF
ncbi:MAG: hypothetical protein IPF81_13885 [Bacteroidetes bacterium]|nr:hypothetical protein [Bacteroidota bacterium]